MHSYSSAGASNTPKQHFIGMTLVELKVYYETIRDRSDIPDNFKLKIANAILDA